MNNESFFTSDQIIVYIPSKMSGHLTIEERIYLVKEYYLNEKSNILLRRKWPKDHPNRKPPTDKTIRCLIEKFDGIMDDKIWIMGEGIDWPPYSPDLNPCDFFLWGYLKDKVYAQNPQTLEQLENIIQTEIFNIPNSVLNDVIENFQLRLHRENGWHIEHILS